MKKIILLVFFSVMACNSKEEKKVKDQATANSNFDWLLGNWIRTNEKEDRHTYENWIKINSHEYFGTCFTIKNNDTIWQENVQLVENSGHWNFAVTPKGENQQTIFKLIKIGNGNFTCENQENEFPKIIKYYTDNQKLKAEIEGGATKIYFEFEK